jgi:hypothetical protein
MKEYEVVYERTEIYREVFKVKANSAEKAAKKAERLNVEHDWTENEMIHGEEIPVQIREVK